MVIGRSNIVGRPMANLLSQKGNPGDCTAVTVCHSRTQNMKEICPRPTLLWLHWARPSSLPPIWKPGAVIDVGITRVASDKTKNGWKLLGDVKFDEVAPKCSFITPVPGGVGPMTIISLMKNTFWLQKREIYK